MLGITNYNASPLQPPPQRQSTLRPRPVLNTDIPPPSCSKQHNDTGQPPLPVFIAQRSASADIQRRLASTHTDDANDHLSLGVQQRPRG